MSSISAGGGEGPCGGDASFAHAEGPLGRPHHLPVPGHRAGIAWGNPPGVDEGAFSYSLDGKSWQTLGNKVPLVYTAPHFTGYRFGIFMYSTQEAGGFADFDGVSFK